jgi:hypothetical protein
MRALAVLSVLLAACATVRPYERELLTDPAMEFGDDPIALHADHVRAYREGAGGESSVGGGGCGCN